jgi:hypothetical protein
MRSRPSRTSWCSYAEHIYAQMKGGGDLEAFEHLIVDRIDLCTYGNMQPPFSPGGPPARSGHVEAK